jgi:hypothetical protein
MLGNKTTNQYTGIYRTKDPIENFRFRFKFDFFLFVKFSIISQIFQSHFKKTLFHHKNSEVRSDGPRNNFKFKFTNQRI